MYIVVGGRSFLGSYLVKNILTNSSESVIATYHSQDENLPIDDRLKWVHLDVTSVASIQSFSTLLESVKAEVKEPFKCVYVVGYIKPDDCLKNPCQAVDTNILSLTNFIARTNKIIDSLIFTSSDFVFGESVNQYKYTERDKPNPINFYGNIKHCCEAIVNLAGYTTVRLPFMFGKSLNPNRPHFIEHVERVVTTGEVFEVLSDYFESSLDYDSVAKLILSLYEKFGIAIPSPVIHICGDETISKYEIAVRYAKERGLPADNLKPIKLEQASFFVAKRATILMDNHLLKSLLGIKEIKLSLK